MRPGALPVVLAAMLWGTTGTSQALAPQAAQPTAVGALRLVVAGAALVLWAVATGRLRGLSGWPWRVTLVAAACMAAYQPLFFSGVERSGVAPGTVVTLGAAPIVAGVLNWLVSGERPGRRWAFATALAIAGAALLILRGAEASLDPFGIALSAAAGAAYAAYVVASKRLVAERPRQLVLPIVFGLAGLLLAPLLLTSELGWVLTPRGALITLHLGLLATALAYVLFLRGLAAISAERAVTLSLAEPLTATALGLGLLGERLTPAGGFGAALLLLALALVSAPSDAADQPSAVVRNTTPR